MLIVKMILALVVFLILLFFANQNGADVSLYYGPTEPIEMPLFLIILGSLLAGMIIALLINVYEKIKFKAQLRALRKEKKRMEGELNSLRKMPIVESDRTNLPEPGVKEAKEGSA